MSVELFYSYAHEDESFREEIEKHLSILKRNGLIVAWHDRRIGAGDEWRDQIDAHARSADIILLLISPDFLASDYCYNIEMKLALERHSTGAAVVVPIILRPVDWSGAPFAELQALPRDGKAVTTWNNRDEAFAGVALGIHAIVTNFSSSTSSVKDPHVGASDTPQSRLLDAAIPSHIVKDRAAELQVLIRLPDSPGLKGVLQKDEDAEARPEDVQSKDFKITFPRSSDGSVEGVKVRITLTAPDFKPPTQTKQLIVPSDSDSDVVSFFLSALRIGKLKILVELQWEEAVRGTRRLVTECIAEAATIPADAGHNVVRMPLELAITQDGISSSTASDKFFTAAAGGNAKPESPDIRRPVAPAAIVQPSASVELPHTAAPPPRTIPEAKAPPRSKAAWIGTSSAIAAVIIAGVIGITYVNSPPVAPASQQVETAAQPKSVPPVAETADPVSKRGATHPPSTPASTPSDRAPALQQEMTARLTAALDQVNKLSETRWLDGNANTNDGTSLRFAGQKLFGLLYFLDHPTGSMPNVPNVAFQGVVEKLKAVAPEQDRPKLQRVGNQYNVLKRLLSDLPGEDAVEHKMTREAVNSTLKRARMLLNSMLQKESGA
jgi:hypothetical protein